MLILLSPSKTSAPTNLIKDNYTLPVFKSETSELIRILQTKSIKEIQALMNISDKLTDQTCKWIESLSLYNHSLHARCAIYNFKGEVYVALNAETMDEGDISFAQNHLRILSGLYGVLKPMDLIQLYRLEMATRLETESGKNLYQFWGDKITLFLNNELETMGSNILINLASEEYFKSVNLKLLRAFVISVDFYEIKQGKKAFVSFSAKKARGLLAAYIIKNRILNFDGLLDFNEEGYVVDNFIQNKNGHITFVKQ